MCRSPFRFARTLLLGIGVLLLLPAASFAEAWTFVYSHNGGTYTYVTWYPDQDTARNAFYAWRRDRYSSSRNPPVFVRLQYNANRSPTWRGGAY